MAKQSRPSRKSDEHWNAQADILESFLRRGKIPKRGSTSIKEKKAANWLDGQYHGTYARGTMSNTRLYRFNTLLKRYNSLLD